MKRPWTALAPCPMAKELIPIHPRKVYYYLTTLPRQPLPDHSDDAMVDKNLTPSVSSMDQDDEDLARERARMSPSPEVDLSSPDFEDDDFSHRSANPGPSFTTRQSRMMHSTRAASPPLEGDEKEFTQTASAVRERASERNRRGASAISEGLSGLEGTSTSSSPMDESPVENLDQADYFAHLSSQDQPQDLDEATTATLFGTSPSPSLASSGTSAPSEGAVDTEESTQSVVSSHRISLPEDPSRNPVKQESPDVDMAEEEELSLTTKPLPLPFDAWRELQSPETVDVDELDEMFGEI